MRKTVKILILTLIIIVLLIISNKKTFNIVQLSDFNPFTNEDEVRIIKENTLKISQDIPTIDVSVAFYPLASSIVGNIYDKKVYNNELNYVSTTLAYEKIASGKVDAIIVTKPSKEQKQMIENANINLKFVPFAEEALIFYISNKNKIISLDIEQIEKIYSGQINNWQEVNGRNNTITTYQLENNNGSQTCFESIVEENIIDKNHIEVSDMGDIINKVALNKNSIGYAFNSFYRNIYNSTKLKLLKINGVEPNKSNILSGKYPLMYNLYFVYDLDNPNKNLEIIENWLLSNEGQKLVEYMSFKSIY